MFCPSAVCLSSVCNVLYCGQTVHRRGSATVPLDRPLVSSYRLSIVTMSLTAAVWPQFATQVFRGAIGRLTCIGRYVNKQVTMFTFLAQATTCSKHHTRTVMDAGCECAPWIRSANPSESWALVMMCFTVTMCVWHVFNNLLTYLLTYLHIPRDQGAKTRQLHAAIVS